MDTRIFHGPAHERRRGRTDALVLFYFSWLTSHRGERGLLYTRTDALVHAHSRTTRTTSTPDLRARRAHDAINAAGCALVTHARDSLSSAYAFLASNTNTRTQRTTDTVYWLTRLGEVDMRMDGFIRYQFQPKMRQP